MKSSTFILLQNEGALMQGCFKSSLTALRTGNSVERGPFYVAFFNYSIALERLLKLLLLPDHWYHDRRFPTNSQLKVYGGKYGHDIEMLYESAKNLFGRYGVESRMDIESDEIDLCLLNFLSDFAKSSRYFNLNTLTEYAKASDPLAVWESLICAVYKKDVSELKRISNEEQVDAAADMIGNHVVSDPSTSMSGVPQSFQELCQEHEMIALVLPEISWRLVKFLVPLKELLVAVCDAIREKDVLKGENASTPAMEEFLDFVCDDKKVILESPDWPL